MDIWGRQVLRITTGGHVWKLSVEDRYRWTWVKASIENPNLKGELKT